jgi:hypothetical protein
MAFALLVCLALGASFDDIHHRFTLDLPEGWEFAPVPGDEGAAFRRNNNGLLANASVRVFELDPADTLEAVAQALKSVVSKEEGYKILTEEKVSLSGISGFRRRAVYTLRDDPRFAKMVEDRVAIWKGRAHVLHVEALAEAFAGFEDDFGRIFSSYVIPQAPAARGAELIRGPFIGRWVMVDDRDTILELRADGTFALAGEKGVFRVEASALTLRPTRGAEETFAYEVSGDELVLKGSALGEPIRYKRAAKAGKGKKTQP